jgi:hypothetical protein
MGMKSEFDNWKVQRLVRDLFVLLSHAQWKDAEHAQSAESWIKSMEAKAIELGFTLDKCVDPQSELEEDANAES